MAETENTPTINMVETENTSAVPIRTQLINLEGLNTFLEESTKIFEPTLPSGVDGQVLKLVEGKPSWGTDNTPTTFTWTEGTSKGPTGTLSGEGMASVSFAAIPSASETASGVVTTGAQTFAGVKTFNDTISGDIDGNAATATSADKTAHGLSVKDSSLASAIDNWDGSTDKTLTIAGTPPIATTAEEGKIIITHDTKGPSAVGDTSKGDTSDQAPAFGETFKVTSATVDVYGHTTALADHTVTIPSSVASSAANGLMSSAHWAKLENIASGAEVNQNAFSNVKVGGIVVEADSKTDTLTLVAGNNVTITPNAANDAITFASSYVDTTYSAGTDLGLNETTFNHKNSGVTKGTYRSVTVNERGHVTAGTNPTTLGGYGITDAKIANGEITLGSNTITPLTADSTLDAGNVSGVLADGNIPDLSASKITTGTLGIARGGTGLSAVASGDILYASGDNTLATLHKGSDGQVLKIEEGKPAWQVANEFEDIYATGDIHADSMHAERNIYAGNINASTVRVGEQLKAPVHAGNINASTVRIDEQLAASHLQLTAGRVIVNEQLNAGELHLTATTLSDRGTLASDTEVDGFLEKSKLKFASFSNYSDIGFGSDDGMIVSIPGATANYGVQIAFNDSADGLVKVRGGSTSNWGAWKQLWREGDAVTGAVWNDLIDCIDVLADDVLEPGYCYCMREDGHYHKSEEYLDSRYIGIDSDTYSLAMNMEPGKRKLNAAVSGFVLAYVDKEYPIGTALTCTENGYLTEIKKEDKCYNPERIIATYWKNEKREEIVKEDRTVKVNGRKWVKIK